MESLAPTCPSQTELKNLRSLRQAVAKVCDQAWTQELGTDPASLRPARLKAKPLKTVPCPMPKLCEQLPHVQSPKVVEPKKPPAANPADQAATMKLLAAKVPAASPADQTGMTKLQPLMLVASLSSLPQPGEYCF